MRATILDLLPRLDGEHGYIDWVSSVGHNIPFVYDGIKGLITIKSVIVYSNSQDMHFVVEYNGRLSIISRSGLRDARLRKVVQAKRKKEKKSRYKPTEFKKGQVLNDGRAIRLLKEGVIPTPQGYKYRGFTYECLDCGRKGFKTIQSLRSGSGCKSKTCQKHALLKLEVQI